MRRERRKVGGGIRKKRRNVVLPRDKQKRQGEENAVIISEPSSPIQRKRRKNGTVTKHHFHISLWRYMLSFLSRYRKYLTLGFLFLALLILLLVHSGKSFVIYHQKQEKNFLQKEMVLTKKKQPSKFSFGVIEIEDEVRVPVKISYREVEGFAHGTVTLFNDYSTQPQRLLPHTRFQSPSGYIFFLGEKEVVIPGKKGKKPGSIDVEIFASEKGEGYNLDLTDFSIPGFKEMGLEDKYHGIYAVSREKFNGGGKRKVAFLASEDKQRAVQSAESLLGEKLQKRLFSAKTEELKLIEKGVQIVFSSPNFLENEGVIALQGRIRALAVSKRGLLEFLQNTYEQKHGKKDFHIEENSVHDILILFLGNQTDNFATLNRITVSIDGEYRSNLLVDESQLQGVLKGTSFAEVSQRLKTIDNLAGIEASITPFWKKRFHEEKEKIILQKGIPYQIKSK